MRKTINPNTPDFVDKSHRIGIDNYIGENPDNIELIEQTILNNRVVLLDAPTSSGKSFAVTGLFNKWITSQGKRCYYLLPKLIQQQQFSKTYLKDIPVINASATEEEKEVAKQLGANITWQGFLMNKYDDGLTEDDVVIVDEAHLLINNQSFINDTKQLVWKLQRAKYRIVLMSGTPNFLALQDLFNCDVLSFHFKNPPPRMIKPLIIKGTLVYNVIHYLRSLDFTGHGLHILRVNDKEKHEELAQWAVDNLELAKHEIQIINKDIADPRWISDDYKYLIENEAILSDKKLLITTIFADEGINVNNINIKSIGIFYDPRLIQSSQRCRDSVIQFCSRFRNLHKIAHYDQFAIKLFLPAIPKERKSQDFKKVFSVQEKSAKYLIHQLAETRKNHNAQMVMQSFPHLFDGTDPQANLVIEVGNSFFKINRQGIYFNTKNQIDLFKSNSQFLKELSAYFTIKRKSNFNSIPKRSDIKSLQKTRLNRLTVRIKEIKPLKDSPNNVISAIAFQSFSEDLKQMSDGLNPTLPITINSMDNYSPTLIKSLEEDALRLLFLRKINFPVSEFAGLLLRKRELHEKMRFLRFMLSREAGIVNSMNNLYFVSFYESIDNIVSEIRKQYVGQGFQVKNDVRTWISSKMAYYLKTKRITANMIIDELFITEENRKMVNGKKITYVSFIRERDITDVVFDFLFFNEQYYPTKKEIKPLTEDYIKKQQEFNNQQGKNRNQQKEQKSNDADSKMGKVRVELDKSKEQILKMLKSDKEFNLKAKQIAAEMVNAFSQSVDSLVGILSKLDELQDKKNAA